jgi:hypothetical protein
VQCLHNVNRLGIDLCYVLSPAKTRNKIIIIASNKNACISKSKPEGAITSTNRPSLLTSQSRPQTRFLFWVYQRVEEQQEFGKYSTTRGFVVWRSNADQILLQ